MLGLVITGHGQFAQGLLHAAKMIAGDLQHVQAVLFEDGANLQDFQEAIKTAIEASNSAYSGTLVLTDLKGGTPFNTAMLASAGLNNVAVLSGTNLPMIIEGGMLSQFSDDALTLGQQLVEVGRSGLDLPVLETKQVSEDEDEGGI